MFSQTFKVPTLLQANVVRRELRCAPSELERVIVLLHGYSQSGRSIFKKLETVFDPPFFDRSEIVALDGPFPIPRKIEAGYKVGFSWYFWDPIQNRYYLGPELAVDFISHVLGELGLADLPKTLIGFSQGGYLTPDLAAKLSRVDHLIGIACELELPDSQSPSTLPYQMDGIYGALDQVVDPGSSVEHHKKVLDLGGKGQIIELAGVGHEINAAVRDALSYLLRQEASSRA